MLEQTGTEPAEPATGGKGCSGPLQRAVSVAGVAAAFHLQVAAWLFGHFPEKRSPVLRPSAAGRAQPVARRGS